MKNGGVNKDMFREKKVRDSSLSISHIKNAKINSLFWMEIYLVEVQIHRNEWRALRKGKDVGTLKIFILSLLIIGRKNEIIKEQKKSIKYKWISNREHQ